MNRSFFHRVGALTAVLLTGTVMLAWPSPASAATSSSATLGSGSGALVANCPGPISGDQKTGTVAVTGGTVTGTAQCAENDPASGAQVFGSYAIGNNIGSFTLQCGSVGQTTASQSSGATPEFQTVTSGGTVTRTVTVAGVVVGQVVCSSTGSYPLAVDVSGSSAAPALATAISPSAESSGSGATWLFVAGAAALLLIAGQVVIVRRIGRSYPTTD